MDRTSDDSAQDSRDSARAIRRAVRRAHLVVTVPTLVLLVGPLLSLLILDLTPSAWGIAIALAAGSATAWCYRMIAAPLWRRYAYRSMSLEDFGPLRAQAIWAGFAWPEGHFMDRREWKPALQRHEERELEAEYLQRYGHWPDMPSYEESPETKIRSGATVVALASTGVLVWRLLGPDSFTRVKPNSLLLYIGAVDVSIAILVWNNPVAIKALAQYRSPLAVLLTIFGGLALGLTDYGIVRDEGVYLTAPAIVPIVLALLGLKK